METTTSYTPLAAVWPWARWGHIPGGSRTMWEQCGRGPVREQTEVRARYPDIGDTMRLYDSSAPVLEEVRTLRTADGVPLQVEIIAHGSGRTLRMDTTEVKR